MTDSKLTIRILYVTEALLLVGAVGVAAWLSSPQEWSPLPLVGLLLVLALVAERLEFEVRGQHLSASLVVLVLAMCLLGPAPAVVFGIVVTVPNSAQRRLSPADWMINLSAFAAFPLVGALIIRALIGDVHDPLVHHLTQSLTFALVVFACIHDHQRT